MRSSRSGRFLRNTATAAMLLVFLVATASAATLTDYRTRIETSKQNIDSMISVLRDQERGSDLDAFVAQTLTSVKKALPESETIEFRGTSINASNGWLKTKLDEFGREANASARIAILTSINERLSSIAEHVKDLESATASNRSKDEDKQKLDEILSRPEYQKREKTEPSLFERLVTKIMDWLRNLFPSPNISPVAPQGVEPLSVVLQVIIYGVIIALVGFLIFKFAPIIIARFGGREKRESGDRVILGEHVDASVSARDLFSEAETLARSGDLRGAIRKGYVALLCDLADGKVIGLARHKTNRDYLRDISKRPTLFERMKLATGSFERHWYGFRRPAAGDWEEFREQYRHAVEEVRSEQ
ncbi:MAG TPA: DUF4129 domain-containing protein [Pyrinomonadaceae bacterium]